MSVLDEQAAVLALTKVTTGPWYRTARLIDHRYRGGATGLLARDFAGLDADDQAAAAALVTRVQPRDMHWAKELILAMAAADVDLAVVGDPATYPGTLDFRFDAPPFLWIRGRRRCRDYRSVAIAGETDIEGAVAAARALAEAGLTVVAGLACELDAAVHETVLAAGGRTLAVLAGGIASAPAIGPYAELADRIADHGHGAVISPFWPDTAPSDRTTELAHIVTSGIAECLYLSDGTADGAIPRLATISINHAGYVWVPRHLHGEQERWVATVGFRGGVGIVDNPGDLAQKASELIDLIPRVGIAPASASTTGQES